MGSNPSSKLSLSSSVVLRSEPQYYGTYVAFDYMKVQTEFLDENEYRILEYLYGKSADIEEVARETKIAVGKCKKFLKHAIELGFVKKTEVESWNLPPEREKVNRELFKTFSIPFLSAPSSVDLFITNRCNLKCVHCFSTRRESAVRDLSLAELQSVFTQLEKMGVLEVRINGGEPLSHPSINKILEMLESRRFRKVIITNGTQLTEKIVKQLKKSNITPTVSLDDSDAQDHDLFRGVEGSFEKTIAGLKILQENGVQYGINCCLHTKNLLKVESIINLVTSLGACRIAFLDLKPLGRMRENKDWMPSHREYEAVLARLISAKAKHRGIDVSLETFLSCYVFKESVLEAKKGYISCRAGKTGLSIFNDGSVYPCNVVVGDPKWNMGNLKNEALKEIWFFRNWAFFRGGVKMSDLEKCRNCKDMKRCEDFYCRLIPYVTTGDPFARNPRCIHLMS